MPNYNIISPLAPTTDLRGQNNNLGLGDGPVNPFAAGVQGLEQGLTFGANLSAKILQTQRENDPDVLAADKLRDDLNNRVLQRSLDRAAVDDPIHAKYADRAALAEISEKESHAEYLKKRADYEKRVDEETRQAKLDEINERIRTSKSKSEAEARKNRKLSPEAFERLKNGGEISESDANDEASGDGTYSGRSFPTLPKAAPAPATAAAPATDTTSVLKQYNDDRVAARKEKTNEVALKATGMHVERGAAPDGTSGFNITGLDRYFDDATGQVKRPLDPATGLATLSEINDLHSLATDPEEANSLAGMAHAVFSTVPMDALNSYISKADEKQRPYLVAQRDTAAAVIASQGNTQYLSQDQKAIQAAGLPFSALKDPEGTNKKVLSVVTKGSASIDDIELKNSLDGNPYLAAFTEASKNGTEPVTITSITPPPVATDGVDSANPATRPPTMTSFQGATGKPILLPTPLVDEAKPDPSEVKRQGQLRYVESLAPKLKDIVSVDQDTEKHIQTIQSTVQQGGMRGQQDTAAANNRSKDEIIDENSKVEKEFYNPELGKRIAPSKDLMTKVLRQEYLDDNRAAITEGNKAKVSKDASEYAREQVESYTKNVVVPLDKQLDAANDDTEKLRPVLRQMDRVVAQAQEEGYQNLFGRKGAAERAEIKAASVAKGGWDAWFNSKSLSEDERKKGILIREMESLQTNMLLPEMKGKSTAFNTTAEQIRGMQAKFSMDTDWETLHRMTAEAKQDFGARNNTMELQSILADRGYRLGGKAAIQALARKYYESGAAVRKIVRQRLGEPAEIVDNPDYRSPEDFLFNPRTGKPTAATQSATTGASSRANEVSTEEDNDRGIVGGSSSSDFSVDGGTTPPASGSTQKKSILDRIMPDWITPANLMRGGGDFKRGVGALVSDPVGSAEKLATGTKEVLTGGTDEERAAAKESLIVRRAKDDPEFRQQVEDFKAEIIANDTTGGSRFVNMVLSSMTNPTIDKVGKALEENFDAVINKAQEFYLDPETINQRQADRDARRIASQELTEDDQLASPWTNTMASAVGFTILNKAVGAVAGGAAKATGALSKPAITKLSQSSPIVKEAIQGIEELAKNPGWTKVLGTGKEIAKDATAYAIPGEGDFTDKLKEGAVMSGALRAGAYGVGKAGSAAKELVRKVTPIAQNDEATALAHRAHQLGVSADELATSDLENASQAVKGVTRDITSDPAGRREMPPEAQLKERYAAEREQAIADAGLDKAPDSPSATAAARSAVESEVQAETTKQVAAQEAEFKKSIQDMITAKEQLAESQAAEFEGKASQGRQQLIANRKKAEQTHAIAVKNVGTTIVGAAESDAVPVLEALVKHTGIKTTPGEVSGPAIASSPKAAVEARLKDIDTIEENLRSSYEVPMIDPESVTGSMSAKAASTMSKQEFVAQNSQPWLTPAEEKSYLRQQKVVDAYESGRQVDNENVFRKTNFDRSGLDLVTWAPTGKPSFIEFSLLNPQNRSMGGEQKVGKVQIKDGKIEHAAIAPEYQKKGLLKKILAEAAKRNPNIELGSERIQPAVASAYYDTFIAPKKATKSIYRIMEETFPELDSDRVMRLEEKLTEANPNIARNAIQAVGKVLNPDNPDQIIPSFEYLDNLHRELSTQANIAYGGSRKVAGPKTKYLQAMVRDVLDTEIAAKIDPKTAGLIGKSDKPYTELNEKYGAVREVEKGIKFYRDTLESLRSDLSMETETNVNYEAKYLGGDKLAEAEAHLGPEATESLRKDIVQMTRAKRMLSGKLVERTEREAQKLEAKAGTVREKTQAEIEKLKAKKPPINVKLSPELDEAVNLTASHRTLGRELLSSGDVGRIKNVQKVLSGPKRTLVEDSVRAAIKEVFIEGKPLTPIQWTNAAEVLLPEEIAALKAAEGKLAGIANKEEALSMKASTSKAEEITRKESAPHTIGKAKFEIAALLTDLFGKPQHRSLTKFEKAAVAKALTHKDPEVVRQLFKKAGATIKDFEEGRAPSYINVLTALGFGHRMAPVSEAARERDREKRRNTPEGKRDQAAVEALRSM